MIEDPDNKPKLSAIIITFNEAEDIGDCLESLTFCDEVVVVDNGSTDGTLDIAMRAGARVIKTSDWPGFGAQKQRALEASRGDWILSIDADERVTPVLRDQILEAVSATDCSSLYLRRINYFLGKRMRFGGWSSDYILRVSRRGRCRFDGAVVHEALVSVDPPRKLSGPLLHFSYKSIREVFDKQNLYATLGARKIVESRVDDVSKSVSPTLKAIWTFVRLYFIQAGFLDGWRGTISASAKSYETFWRYALSRSEK